MWLHELEGSDCGYMIQKTSAYGCKTSHCIYTTSVCGLHDIRLWFTRHPSEVYIQSWIPNVENIRLQLQDIGLQLQDIGLQLQDIGLQLQDAGLQLLQDTRLRLHEAACCRLPVDAERGVGLGPVAQGGLDVLQDGLVPAASAHRGRGAGVRGWC